MHVQPLLHFCTQIPQRVTHGAPAKLVEGDEKQRSKVLSQVKNLTDLCASSCQANDLSLEWPY